MLWTIVYIVGGVIALLALVALVLSLLGRSIPVEHTATSAMNLGGPPEPIFRLIEDVAEWPRWAPGVTRVEMLPEQRGLETCRMRVGHISCVMTRTLHQPPHRLERTIVDDRSPFSGTWSYTIEERPDGRCQVRLTETGRITSAMARAIMKHILGYHKYTHKHLRGLAKALGQEGTPHRA